MSVFRTARAHPLGPADLFVRHEQQVNGAQRLEALRAAVGGATETKLEPTSDLSSSFPNNQRNISLPGTRLSARMA